MRLTESQLRQIIEEEWSALVAEAEERRIVRPGGPTPGAVANRPSQAEAPPKISASSASPARPKDISDIQATRSKMVSGSPFEAGSDAFNALYNGGNAEEFIMFRVKSKVTNDEFLMGRLVSHTFNPGTYVTVPGLFENKLGVGKDHRDHQSTTG